MQYSFEENSFYGGGKGAFPPGKNPISRGNPTDVHNPSCNIISPALTLPTKHNVS